MDTVLHPLCRDVLLFCFLSDFPVTSCAVKYLQYQPNGRWNISKMLYKTSRLRGRNTLYCVFQINWNVLQIARE